MALRMSPERQTRVRVGYGLVPGMVASSLSFTMDEQNVKVAQESSLPQGGFTAVVKSPAQILQTQYIDQEGTLNVIFGAPNPAMLRQFVAPESAGAVGVSTNAMQLRIYQARSTGEETEMVSISEFHLEVAADLSAPDEVTDTSPVWVEVTAPDPRDIDQTPILGTGGGDFIDASGFLHKADGSLWYPAPSVGDTGDVADPDKVFWTAR